MRKKASKMNRYAAKIVGTFGNGAAMGADLPDPVKCMMPCAHSVGRRPRSRSNRVTIGRFCAGTALPPAADKHRNHISHGMLFLAHQLSGPSGSDFFWSYKKYNFLRHKKTWLVSSLMTQAEAFSRSYVLSFQHRLRKPRFLLSPEAWRKPGFLSFSPKNI